MLTICWEAGTPCTACGGEVILGEETLYGRHLGCARDAAEARRHGAPPADVLAAAQAQLAAGGRIVLTRPQLRELIALALRSCPSFIPVRRPDKALGPMRWYSRVTGWDPGRVAAGLSAPEVAGLWLDCLDVGRTPPLARRDLQSVLDVIAARA